MDASVPLDIFDAFLAEGGVTELAAFDLINVSSTVALTAVLFTSGLAMHTGSSSDGRATGTVHSGSPDSDAGTTGSIRGISSSSCTSPISSSTSFTGSPSRTGATSSASSPDTASMDDWEISPIVVTGSGMGNANGRTKIGSV
jgi:hypothetical protein